MIQVAATNRWSFARRSGRGARSSGWVRQLLGLVLATGLVAVLEECSEDDGLSNASYFATLEAAADDLDKRTDTIDPRLPLRTEASQAQAAWAETLFQLEDVAPPMPLIDEHNAYIDALRAFVQLWAELLAGLERDASDQQVEVALTKGGWLEARSDLDGACSMLRDAAADEGITIYLHCSGGGD